MHYPKEAPRHYAVGIYTCPTKNIDVELEADVPRPWVHWPMRVICQACGEEHEVRYEDVLEPQPAFGHE